MTSFPEAYLEYLESQGRFEIIDKYYTITNQADQTIIHCSEDIQKDADNVPGWERDFKETGDWLRHRISHLHALVQSGDTYQHIRLLSWSGYIKSIEDIYVCPERPKYTYDDSDQFEIIELLSTDQISTFCPPTINSPTIEYPQTYLPISPPNQRYLK